ncbi:hypothetical protein D3C72_740030 [compost metagenome]
MNSFTFLAGTEGCTTIVFVTKASSAMGVKSLTPSKGILEYSAWFIVCVLIEPTSSV